MIGWLILASETAAPTALQTYGPAGAILLALGGWKGLALGILRLQGRSGSSEDKYNPQLCKWQHKQIEEERKQNREDMKYMRRQISRISSHLHIPDGEE